MRKYFRYLSIIFFVVFLHPIEVKCQLHGKYDIQVNIGDGTKVKPAEVKLLDSTKKLILKKYCDSFGQCRFTGVNKGVYRLINKRYKVDTMFAIPDTDMLKALPQLIIFDIDIDRDICEFNGRLARKEIRKSIPRLILIGGLAPTYFFGQERFEHEFNIRYYEFGDSGEPERCALRYNRVVFAYLDKRYGNTWRYKVRKDIIGVRNYIKTHPVKY